MSILNKSYIEGMVFKMSTTWTRECYLLLDNKNLLNSSEHRQRTPNEGINQRKLKIMADVADKIYFGRT